MQSDLLLEGFMRHLRVERGLSENTCLSYGYQLGAYVAFLRGRGREPAAAAREDVLAYLERRKDDGLNVIWVRDNRAGFDRAHAEKLFAAFERLHAQ